MEKKPYPSELQERFIIRLPDGMRDRIADAAKRHMRSMNAEIVARLQESFTPTLVAGDAETAAMLAKHAGDTGKVNIQLQPAMANALIAEKAQKDVFLSIITMLLKSSEKTDVPMLKALFDDLTTELGEIEAQIKNANSTKEK